MFNVKDVNWRCKIWARGWRWFWWCQKPTFSHFTR